MLFDLTSGRRKRVVQVVYSILALLMGGGLVFFGIGSDVSGGLFNAFEDGNGGANGSQFSDDADEIDKQLESDPRNAQLLAELVRLRYSAANSEVTIDEATQQQSYTEEAFTQFQAAAEAWDRYLATKPRKPDADVAGLAASATFYAALTSEDVDEIRGELRDAVEAQQIAAEARPNLNSFLTLARYAYYAGDDAAAAAAAARAKAEAPKAQLPTVNDALDSYAQEGKTIKRQLAAFEARQQGGQGGQETLENPLGELSGGGLGGP